MDDLNSMEHRRGQQTIAGHEFAMVAETTTSGNHFRTESGVHEWSPNGKQTWPG